MPGFPHFHEKTKTPRVARVAGSSRLLPGEDGSAPVEDIRLAPVESSRPLPATPATPEVSALSAPATPGGMHLEDIMALPLRPCTTCANLNWHDREFIEDDGTARSYRSRECDHYSKRIPKDQAVKCCRCVHYTPRYA